MADDSPPGTNGVDSLHARVPGEAEARTATVNYTHSAADLTLQKLEVSGAYRAIHKAFERAGRLEHPMGAEEEKALGAVVRWNGTRFVPLGRPLNEPPIVRDRKTPSERAGS